MIFPQNRPRPDRDDREVADYFRQKMAHALTPNSPSFPAN